MTRPRAVLRLGVASSVWRVVSAVALALGGTAVVAASPSEWGTVGLEIALAQSWNLIGGYGGYPSLGQVAPYGVGAYALGLSVVYLHLNVYSSLALAVAGGAVFCAATGLLAPRRRAVNFAVVTLAVAAGTEELFSLWGAVSPGGTGLTVSTVGLHRAGAYIGSADFGLVAGAVAVLATLVVAIVSRSRMAAGATLQRADLTLSEACGVASRVIPFEIFLVSGAIAGLAGGVAAIHDVVLEPSTMFDPGLSVLVVAAVVLGGRATVAGPVIGVLALSGLEVAVGYVVPGAHQLALAAVTVAAIVIDPRGLVSSRAAKWSAHPRANADTMASAEAMAPALGRHGRIQTGTPAAGQTNARQAHTGKSHAVKGPIVEVSGLTKRFGGRAVLVDVNLEVRPGEVLALIGPNGAGKTTLLDCISALVRPDGGEVLIEGCSTRATGPSRLAGIGLARSFQVPRPVHWLSVSDQVGLAAAYGSTPRLGRSQAQGAAWDALDKLGLLEQRQCRPGQLSTGGIRRLEIARVVAMRPKIAILDEPLAGLSSDEVEVVVGAVCNLASSGSTVIVVEHLVSAVWAIADSVAFLDAGRVVRHGTSEEVLTDPVLLEPYLGSNRLTRLRL